MKINKSNYEAYFLDFVEGKLTANQQAELDLFLAVNPDLKFELDSFDEVILPKEECVDKIAKSELIRNEETGLNEMDYLLISELENTLSEVDKQSLIRLNSESSKVDKERAFYSKTKLNKDEVVLFPNKARMIKKPAKLIYFYRYAASVAAAVLALFLFNLNFSDDQYEPRKIEFANSEIEKEIPMKAAYVIFEEQKAKEPKTLKKNKPSTIIYAAQKLEKPIIPASFKEQEPVIKISEAESLAEIPAKETPKETENQRMEPNEVEKQEEKIAQVSASEEFVPLVQFAKNKFKEEVLKNKTLTETLAEELAAATNQKISFEAVKNQEGKTEQLAINIGKFSFSRKK